MAADARQRMIISAAVLFRERGIEATAFADIVAHSGAPRGSIYHHFPGGKAQLVEEATRYAGDFIAAQLATALDRDDPVAALRVFFDQWRDVLRDSDFASGCPVAAATLAAAEFPAGRDAAGEGFRRWETLIAERLGDHGLPKARARSFGTLALAAIEGAVVLARAQRDLAPLTRVRKELEAAARAALEEAKTATR
ncbi:TetR/AcrR family transcriptional regulator [Amycolatopsis anabasis]|uniref:TetR/AcrR family transcriptional regulator n=1 Tax=Amycolatopsis anabasis TaxID=1840409 RepID=UPI0015D1B5BF|nr:TetR/AcrR family transcriptional regulator [Amycolatopsis anabasis]